MVERFLEKFETNQPFLTNLIKVIIKSALAIIAIKSIFSLTMELVQYLNTTL